MLSTCIRDTFNLQDFRVKARGAGCLLALAAGLVTGSARAGEVAIYDAVDPVELQTSALLGATPPPGTTVTVEQAPSFGTLTPGSGVFLYTPGAGLAEAGGDSFLLRVEDLIGSEIFTRVTLVVPLAEATITFKDGVETYATPWTSMSNPNSVLSFTSSAISGDVSLRADPNPGGVGWLFYRPPSSQSAIIGDVGGDEGQNIILTSLPDVPPPGQCFPSCQTFDATAVIYRAEQTTGPGSVQIVQDIDDSVARVRAEAYDDGVCSAGCVTGWLSLANQGANVLDMRIAVAGSTSTEVLMRLRVTQPGQTAVTAINDDLPLDLLTFEDHYVGTVEHSGDVAYHYVLDDFEIRTQAWRTDETFRHLEDEVEDGWHPDWNLALAGALDRTAEAAIHGDWGLDLDVQELYQNPSAGGIVRAYPAEAQPSYGARFDLDTSRLDLPAGGLVRVWGLLAGSIGPLAVDLDRDDTGDLRLRLRGEGATGGPVFSAWTAISGDVHQVAVRYESEAGTAKLWLGGVEIAALSGLDTQEVWVTGARLGGFNLYLRSLPAGDLGHLSIDGYAAWF